MNIMEIQCALVDMGCAPGPVDGLIGPKTLAAVRRLLVKYEPKHKVPTTSNARLLIAAEQVIMREIGGLAVGPIDGIVGPVTERARKYWSQGPWRNALMKYRTGDQRMPATVKNTWPTQADVEAYYGAPGANQVLFYPPYPLRLYEPNGTMVSRFSCHKKVQPSLERVLSAVLAHYGYDRLRELRLDVFSGCLNVRPMRGGKALSMHSWGIAVDWDAQRNPLNMGRDRAPLARPEYDAWWDAWTAEGWLSMGKARNFDWMHVQAARLG